MWNDEDVANASADPFNLSKGRHNVVITESGEFLLKTENANYNTWKISVYEEDTDTKQDILTFLDFTDAKGKAQVNSKIKKILDALEIPDYQEGDTADTINKRYVNKHPEVIVGTKVIVERVEAKNGKMYTNILGIASDEDFESDDDSSPTDLSGLSEFAGGIAAKNPFLS